jgi:hypothetical protein
MFLGHRENAAMELRGRYRIKSLHGIPNGVWVSDGTSSYEIPQQEYVEMGLQPPLEDLAWDPEQLKDLALRPRHQTTTDSE